MINTGTWQDLDINKLVKADWNYKVEDEEKTEKLLNNVKRNGQVESIIVRELETGYYEVVNGNHRLDVFKQLEFKKVHVCNVHKIDDYKAQRLAIETNETRFASDNIKLAELITNILTQEELSELEKTMPYSALELENFRKLKDFDWEQFNSKASLVNASDLEDKDKELTFKVSAGVYDRFKDVEVKFKNKNKIKTEDEFVLHLIECLQQKAS